MAHRHVLKEVILAIIGGLIYILIELIWRGHTYLHVYSWRDLLCGDRSYQ